MLAKVLAPVTDLLSNARQATGTLPAAVELALHEHDEIAAAIEARASKRARRAMTTHIQSGIWALSQLRGLSKSENPPPTPALEPPSTPDRRRAGAARRRGRRRAASKSPAG